MNRNVNALCAVLVALFAASGLAACSEKPQQALPQADSPRTSEHWKGQLRERTLNQGGSERMGL
jgi:hypothetical protein